MAGRATPGFDARQRAWIFASEICARIGCLNEYLQFIPIDLGAAAIEAKYLPCMKTDRTT
jgi:hypothetical protein